MISITWNTILENNGPSTQLFPAANQGFPRRGGGHQPEKRGAPTNYLDKFHQKLHENEENWTGGTTYKILLCRSATDFIIEACVAVEGYWGKCPFKQFHLLPEDPLFASRKNWCCRRRCCTVWMVLNLLLASVTDAPCERTLTGVMTETLNTTSGGDGKLRYQTFRNGDTVSSGCLPYSARFRTVSFSTCLSSALWSYTDFKIFKYSFADVCSFLNIKLHFNYVYGFFLPLQFNEKVSHKVCLTCINFSRE